MNKVFPYLYFVFAALWLVHGVKEIIGQKESFYLFLGYETSNIYEYLGFKIIIGILLIFGGIRRLKLANNQ